MALFLVPLLGWSKTFTDQDLRKISELVKDSSKLRQSLPSLQGRAKAKDADSRLLYAKALLSINQTDAALDVLKTINSDVDVRSLVLQSKAYEIKKEHKERIRVLELLRKHYSTSEYVALLLADAYDQAKDRNKAIATLKEQIKISPKQKAAYVQLLNLYQKANNAYEIRILLSDMKQIFAKDPEVAAGYCQYYAAGGFLKQALESCQEAIGLDPKNPDNFVYLGITKKNLKQTEDAETIIKRAAKDFPNSEIAQYVAGQLMDDSKNWEVSARYYQACVQNHPESDRCQHSLGKAAFELERYDVALKAYSVACNKIPQARVDFRNSITKLRNKFKNTIADEYTKKFELCSLH